MHITLDQEEDRLRFILGDRPVSYGDEPVTGFHFYYDAEGHVVGFDIDDASIRVQDPRQVEFELES